MKGNIISEGRASTSTMPIKPENLDPCPESSFAITNDNIVTESGNTNNIYRKKVIYIYIYI